MDLDVLLGPVSEQAPCGPNLEYDADFQALEAAARGKPEQVIGEVRVAPVPPIWTDVRDLAQELLGKTKDLRVAIWWMRSAIALSGLVGARDGLKLIHRLLTTFWEDIHPQIDPADRDPGFRINALSGLLDASTVLSEIRHAVIADVPRKGRVTVSDVLVATGRLQPGAGVAGRTLAEVRSLLQESASESARLEAAVEAFALENDVQRFMLEKVGAERMPDFQPLRDLLAPVAETCRAALEASTGGSTTQSPPGDGTQESQAAQAAAPGVIRTREDAIRILDRVCEYLERSEPANPAPLLIRRAQRLMSKNFMEIIEDLTPDSAAAIRALGGIKD